MKIVNIIVILLSVCSNFCAWGQQKNVNQLSREEEKDGFQLLFDGQSLNNWINNAEEYFVEDGCIVKKIFWIWKSLFERRIWKFYFTF